VYLYSADPKAELLRIKSEMEPTKPRWPILCSDEEVNDMHKQGVELQLKMNAQVEAAMPVQQLRPNRARRGSSHVETEPKTNSQVEAAMPVQQLRPNRARRGSSHVETEPKTISQVEAAMPVQQLRPNRGRRSSSHGT
jgi:hypothetical protein